jgi:TfoX/Sxy family transcriptional regulator of competence genes
MATSDGFIELLQDTLSGFGPVSVRRMFGGAASMPAV